MLDSKRLSCEKPLPEKAPHARQPFMSQKILITGANRGLGLEFVSQYLAEGAYVFAAARKPYSPALLTLAETYQDSLCLLALDVTSAKDLQAAVDLVEKQAGKLDLLINNAGVYPRNITLGHHTKETLLDTLHINAVAPMLIGQAFLPLLRESRNPKLVNISTQLGSFGVNTTGRSAAYSGSKAALNMYTRSFAHEAKSLIPHLITIAVHPGWVKTDLGGPGAPLSANVSVTHMRRLIERLTLEDNGQFFNYDGQAHPW